MQSELALHFRLRSSGAGGPPATTEVTKMSPQKSGSKIRVIFVLYHGVFWSGKTPAISCITRSTMGFSLYLYSRLTKEQAEALIAEHDGHLDYLENQPEVIRWLEKQDREAGEFFGEGWFASD